MELTEERVREIALEVFEEQKPVKGDPTVKAFKDEVKEWCHNSEKPGGNYYTLQTAIYRAVVKKIGIKNIQSLKVDQLPEARKVFEEFKQIVS